VHIKRKAELHDSKITAESFLILVCFCKMNLLLAKITFNAKNPNVFVSSTVSGANHPHDCARKKLPHKKLFKRSGRNVNSIREIARRKKKRWCSSSFS